jgi:hypothetical protein
MQLRVARLCLDCEELHNADTCPRCASQAYAFLSNWLPVDERRKWRRPAAAAARGPWWAQTPAEIVRAFGRWLAGDSAPAPSLGPATRAADRAATMHFDTPAPKDTASPGTTPHEPHAPSATART